MAKALICCSITVDDPGDVASGLECAVRAAADGATLVEWRIDALGEESGAVEHVARLLRESPLPSIVTCRRTSEGGRFDGDETDRVSLLEAIGTADPGPRYIDFELADYRRSANVRQKIDLVIAHENQVRDLETGLILSAHDFDGRPHDLLRQVTQMGEASACAVGKVAWHARSLRDNLEAFDLLRARTKPMIALCMGEFGVMSRILASKFGGLLTFASVDAAEATAPGQPTIRELRETYRFDSISSSTKVFGIAGWPVHASWSPAVHNAGFDAIGFDGVYLRLPIPPEWEHFKATIGSFLDHDALDFSGMSVTMPHKEHLVRFVQEEGGELDRVSALCGAANTLVVDPEGSLKALNTDAPAAVDSLVSTMGIERSGLSGARIAILGAGGVARAVAAGLLETGAELVVSNRTPERAERLVADLREGEPRARIETGGPETLVRDRYQAFINCTSVGLPSGPAPDESPLPAEVTLDDSVVVLETIYARDPTPLARHAASCGARVATGESMFVRQAELQFAAWTGKSVPTGLFERVLGLA